MVKSAMNQTVEGTHTGFKQHVGTPTGASGNNVQADKEGSFTPRYPLSPVPVLPKCHFLPLLSVSTFSFFFLRFYFILFFLTWPRHAACGILVP